MILFYSLRIRVKESETYDVTAFSVSIRQLSFGDEQVESRHLTPERRV